MELVEFFDEVRNDIAIGIDAYNETQLSQFLRIYTDELKCIGEIEDFELCLYYDQKSGIRVDGYWENSDDGILSLFVADYNERTSLDLLSKSEIQKIVRRIVKFVETSRTGTLYQNLELTAPEYGLSKMIHQRFQSFFKINIYILSERKLSARVKALEIEEIDGKPLHKHIWDISRLYQQYLSKSHKESVEIDCLEMFNHGIPCLPVDCGAEEYESYLAVISGEDLADLYERYDSRLLEQNVRTFLQARGKVNQGIRTTILTEPSMFFAYNNGITATAQKIEVDSGPQGLFISRFTDLQIVNGGQTTASLFHARRKEKASLDKIFVQMKLSVINPELSEKIVPLISEYANTQNRVNAADFFSNAPFHLRMKELSERVLAPARYGAVSDTKWFYERVRGQYIEAQSKLTPAEKKKFQTMFPKQQVFTKEDLAKYENVWDEHPQVVSKGRQKNFAAYAGRIGKEWEKDNKRFNEYYYKQAIARAILFRETERVVSSRPWYRPGGSIRSYIVYYSLACLGELAKRRKAVIPFLIVWEQQDVPDFLRGAIEKSADYINDHIENPTDTLFPGDSEWFKKEACWNALQNGLGNLESRLTDKFWNSLVSMDEYQILMQTGKATQRIDDDIALQKRVLQIPKEQWQIIVASLSKLKISPKGLRQLKMQIEHPSNIPEPWQCQILLKIYELAINEGIVSDS